MKSFHTMEAPRGASAAGIAACQLEMSPSLAEMHAPSSALCTELQAHVLSFLEAKDILAAAQVDRAWYQSSTMPVLWERVVREELPIGAWECLGQYKGGEAGARRLFLDSLERRRRNEEKGRLQQKGASLRVQVTPGVSEASLLQELGAPVAQAAAINGIRDLFTKHPSLRAPLCSLLASFFRHCHTIDTKKHTDIEPGRTVLTVSAEFSDEELLYEIVEILANCIYDQRFVLLPDPTFSKSMPWKLRRRAKQVKGTSSTIKASRRKRAVPRNAPSIIVSNFLKAHLSSPWLFSRNQSYQIFVHKGGREDIPLWLGCLPGTEVIACV